VFSEAVAYHSAAKTKRTDAAGFMRPPLTLIPGM